ncbi:hypothetical protein TNCV_1140741 [Trichonephila clavipes]|nr:hypothetical protein TNCV_1140741 [Trichonephila clavipes]
MLLRNHLSKITEAETLTAKSLHQHRKLLFLGFLLTSPKRDLIPKLASLCPDPVKSKGKRLIERKPSWVASLQSCKAKSTQRSSNTFSSTSSILTLPAPSAKGTLGMQIKSRDSASPPKFEV